MYQKLRKSHLLLRMKLFVISLVYGLIFLIAALKKNHVWRMWDRNPETWIGTLSNPLLPVPATLVGPAVKTRWFNYSISLTSRDVEHFCDDVRILIIDSHFSYRKGTSFGPILLCFQGNLCYLWEVAQYNPYFLVNLGLLTVKVRKVR